MYFVEDGYITGALSPHIKRCGRCGKKARCIDIATVTLPGSMTWAATLLWDKVAETHITNVGLTCGCYARFHRQVAHIVDSQLKSGHAFA